MQVNSQNCLSSSISWIPSSARVLLPTLKDNSKKWIQQLLVTACQIQFLLSRGKTTVSACIHNCFGWSALAEKYGDVIIHTVRGKKLFSSRLTSLQYLNHRIQQTEFISKYSASQTSWVYSVQVPALCDLHIGMPLAAYPLTSEPLPEAKNWGKRRCFRVKLMLPHK